MYFYFIFLSNARQYTNTPMYESMTMYTTILHTFTNTAQCNPKAENEKQKKEKKISEEEKNKNEWTKERTNRRTRRTF